MTTEALPKLAGEGRRSDEYRAITLVSAAHFANHFQNLVLPPLFPFLTSALGVGFVELGFALTLSNILSVAAQLPVGFLVDRFGSRHMLIAGLMLAGLAFIGVGLAPSYPHLLIAMAVVGLSNSVFHPADYALLSARIAPARIGRAFSIHTFAGYLGWAVAPLSMVAIVAAGGLGLALVLAGALGVAIAAVLAVSHGLDTGAAPGLMPGGAAPAERQGLAAILTPTILALTGFFALVSLSGSGISSFSVVALTTGYGTPLALANLALTMYMTAQACGVLAGGFVADMTRRHAEVAAVGYGLNACIVLMIGTVALGAAPLLGAMAAAGFLGGLILPSRDMLVRAAAPPGAVGRTFGVVTTGFNIAGTIGPLLFGWIMDQGLPQWVFRVSVIIMVLTAAIAWLEDRRTVARRRRASPCPPRPTSPAAARIAAVPLAWRAGLPEHGPTERPHGRSGGAMLVFRQLFDPQSSTYTYLLGDRPSGEAVLIDPVFEQVRRDTALLDELGLRLIATLETHVHADHVTGAWLLKRGAGSRIMLAKASGAEGADRCLGQDDVVQFGGRRLLVRATPGHTNSCLTYVLDDRSIAFTGDCLLIRGSGRTDFQQGDPAAMYRSIHEQIFTLPDDCLLYPAHDYRGLTVTSVAEERRYNPRIGGEIGIGDFTGYMKNLRLAHPKLLDIAVPANLRCGRPDNEAAGDGAARQPGWAALRYSFAGVWEIDPHGLEEHVGEVQILDVREPDEFTGPLGHIRGAVLIPLGELAERAGELDRTRPVVAVCRAGGRSAQATVILQQTGFTDIANLTGGMLRWRAEGHPVEGGSA